MAAGEAGTVEVEMSSLSVTKTKEEQREGGQGALPHGDGERAGHRGRFKGAVKTLPRFTSK